MEGAPPVLESFGKYRVVRELGAGGMGAVYEATHITLKRRVALKTLLPSVVAIPGAVERFVREGELAARIGHPHTVDVIDVGVEDGVAYLVMEFLEGRDLAALLAAEGPLTVERTADILVPVTAAVAAAHAAGVVHRDLKPENIFITTTRSGELHPKVVDFGISKAMTGEGGTPTLGLTGTGALLGTPFYMSPEQAQSSKHVDGRSDVYALGVILYKCLTGSLPFEGASLYEVLTRIVTGEYTPPRTLVPALSLEIASVVTQAMHHDRGKRTASAAALGTALLPYASERTRTLFATELARAECTDAHAPTMLGATPSPVARPAISTLGRSVRELEVRQPTKNSRVAVGGSVLVAFLVVGGIAVWRPWASAPSLTPPQPVLMARYVVRVATTPTDARITLDGRPRAQGFLTLTLPANGESHTLGVVRDGYEPRSFTFVDAPPPAEVALERLLPPGVALPTIAPPTAPSPTEVGRGRRRVRGQPAPDGAHPAVTLTRTTEPPAPTQAEPSRTAVQTGTNGSLIIH